MSEVVLQCKKLTKRINKKDIIQNISFTINKGDILGLIGPNGSGKTTTIKTILGLYKSDYGTIKVNNYSITKNFPNYIKNIGAIIESPDLYMYLTGYENLKISQKIYNLTKERVEEVVKLVGLQERINDKVKTYSLGMRQRLGIAIAILHNPDLLILDEPTNGLDPQGIIDLKNLLKSLAKRNMAIIISSHILTELESFCNKFIIISNGKIKKKINKSDLTTILSTTNYILEVDNTNLNNYLLNYNIIDKNHIKINIDPIDLTKILKVIITSGTKIYEVKKETLTLEQLFLKLVGGNKID